jgi:choline dehydrogenase-like flavoprotein
MSEEGSITGSIERSNSGGETIVLAGTAAGSALLLQAYASGLILDDTTGSLVVTRNIIGLSLEECPTDINIIGTTGMYV